MNAPIGMPKTAEAATAVKLTMSDSLYDRKQRRITGKDQFES